MEHGKRLSSNSEERQTNEKVKISSKCSFREEEKKKEDKVKNRSSGLPSRSKQFKPSMIPIVKGEKNGSRDHLQKERHSSCSTSRLCCTSYKTDKRNEDLTRKLKLLEEKENSIAEYYLKIENMILNFMCQKEKNENEKPIKRKIQCPNSVARKMASDPSVFNNTKIKDDILSEFESNVQLISEIWLKTSTDLTNTLKNLKNNPPLDPMEFEIENARIQLAIKQAKSLTLVKTRNIITEAKKLIYNQEIIRTELENLLSQENIKLQNSKCFRELPNMNVEEKKTLMLEDTEKQEVGATGDSPKGTDLENHLNERDTNSHDDSEKEKNTSRKRAKFVKGDFNLEDRKNSSDEKLKEQNESDQFDDAPLEPLTEVEVWMRELAKKNKTIANLNTKIFELQKSCNEHSLKYNQIQVKLSEFHEKIEWNQVLWKQIGKLKEQIKGLQQSNKQLEIQKKELECKITRLDQELDRLIKINRLLNQKKYLLKAQETSGEECKKRESKRDLCKLMNENFQKVPENKFCVDEKIFLEKQKAVNQLKIILNVMRDQENFAQHQISVFQSKIEELEKNVKA